MTHFNNTNSNILSNEDLARKAPSVFAVEKSPRVSDKYKYVPTIEVIDALRGEGWNAVQAVETKVRKEERRGFQKHMVRFRQAGDIDQNTVGDSLPELVLTNSHDGTAAYQLHAGLFRLVCSNGLVIADATFTRIAIRHVGFDMDELLESSHRIIEEVPQIAATVEQMRSVILNTTQQEEFAEKALLTRYKTKEDSPIESHKLLLSRRYEDRNNDLWSVFNRIQENVIQGGLRGFTKTNSRTRTRAIRSINENININKAIWGLAEQFKVAA